jgi:hypothetical protein
MAAGFEDFVKGLDLPAERVPAQLFDGFPMWSNRQIGDEFPIDGQPARRLLPFLGEKHGQGQRRIPFLVSHRRQHVDAAGLDFDVGDVDTISVIGNLDVVT